MMSNATFLNLLIWYSNDAKLNLLTKDLCDEERPAHEGQYIEEDDATEKESMRKVEAVNKDNKEDLVKIGMTPP